MGSSFSLADRSCSSLTSRAHHAGRRVARIASALVIVPVMLLSPAAESQAALPVPGNCQVDISGANDTSGTNDLSLFCVGRSDTDPWIVLSLVNLDEIRIAGAGTVEACSLYDTNDDSRADLAACVTLRSSGVGNDNLTAFQRIRLYDCDDTHADRCSGAVLVPSPHDSVCEVLHPESDPFGPATLEGLGDEYPFDTQLLCAFNMLDFAVAAPTQRLLDVCSYPSQTPDSDPGDCVLFSSCDRAADCDDDNDCTLDACDAGGVCTHGPDLAAPCTDGLFCTGEEICNALGFCQRNAQPLNCDDGWECTLDACDELADTCVNDPRDSLCSDGDFCNGIEMCMPVVAGLHAGPVTRGPGEEACMATPPPDCDDNVACTLDTCDSTTGSCIHAPVDALCDDGSACNGLERCDATAGCSDGAVPDCDDGIACTVDACREPAGACSHTAEDAACTDGLHCNGLETCDPAGGCVPGILPACDDGVACTTDACDEALGGCRHQVDDTSCGDAVFCNGMEVCDPNAGCRPGTTPCTGPTVCSEDSDACVGCLGDADCSNGVYCDGQEICEHSTGTCLPGTPVSCIDGIGCTIDSCDEAGDRCVHDPEPAACDNGLFCDGTETCSPDADCRPGTPPACDDHIACTVDRCVEATESCTHRPDDAACNNGQFCDGVEVCDASIGCSSGSPVTCPGDRVQCSTERCDEATDRCTSDFSRCVCGDREIVFPEECDPPARAGTFEDCNNLIDDDGDQLVDCADPGCLPGEGRGGTCDEDCKVDQLCKRVESDPAAIVFNRRGGPSSFWVHGRFPVRGMPDPMTEGFRIQVSNEVQPIFLASLGAGDLAGDASGQRFTFSDKSARALGQASARGGLARVQLRLRLYGGVRYLTFRVQAYGDFSAATLRLMRTDVELGSEVATLTARWRATPKSWLLHQQEF